MTLEIDLINMRMNGNAKSGDIKRLGLLKASMEAKEDGKQYANRK